MSSVGDRCIHLFKCPFVQDVYRTAISAILLQGLSKRVPLCQPARVHETTGGNVRVGLTLSFGENVKQLWLGKWCHSLLNGVELGWGRAETSWMR